MLRSVGAIYLASFFCYVLFTRQPDFINGDVVKGVVTKAAYSSAERQPEIVIAYKVGSEELQHSTNKWFLTRHYKGQQVKVIYDPSHPEMASIYSFIGYWIRWPELIFTAIFFVVLFGAARSITGKVPRNEYR